MSQTIDPEEIERFDKVAAEWWDEDGAYMALHALNPARIGYLRDQICFHFSRDSQSKLPLKGLRILDIGCGGGLVCEPLARLGAEVTGLDASAKNIEAAKAHSQEIGLNIKYIADEAANLIGDTEPYDVVTALEVVEHVSDVSAFLKDCRALTKDDGGLGFSTINKTLASLAVAKIGAEYIARLVPRGTHDWRKFLKPNQLSEALEDAGFKQWDVAGIELDVLQRRWRTSDRPWINYIGWANAV